MSIVLQPVAGKPALPSKTRVAVAVRSCHATGDRLPDGTSLRYILTGHVSRSELATSQPSWVITPDIPISDAV